MTVEDAIGTQSNGNKSAILGYSFVNTTNALPVRDAYVGVYGQTLSIVNSNGLAAQGWPNQIVPAAISTSLGNYQGGVWGGVSYVNQTGAYWWGTTAHEFDVTYTSNMNLTAVKTGIAIDDFAATPYFANYENNAIIFSGTKGFTRLISFGGEGNVMPLTSSGTVMATVRQEYNGYNLPGALYGIDFRTLVVGSGGAAWASKMLRLIMWEGIGEMDLQPTAQSKPKPQH